MSSETTPLLLNSTSTTYGVYNRFSTARKRAIVAIIAFAGVISPFTSGVFVPCVPQVADDLHTTGTLVNLTVGLYILVMALGTLIWAPYSSFYGRQPVYLASLPLLCIGSLAAAACQNIHQLAIARCIQAFGAASVMSVGAGTISDLYRVEERGRAMGIYISAVFLGPAIAPTTGGLAATYASWRLMQLILFGMALLALILIAVFLPETSHPGSRGIDRLYAEQLANEEPVKWRFVWMNPFKSFYLLKGPSISLIILAGAFTLSSNYTLLIPLAYTIGERYGITNPAIIGLCFLPDGLGTALGAPLVGYLSDRAVSRGLKKRGGKWYPEDRLRATIPGALVLVPMSILIFGLTTTYVSGKIGLIIDLVCLFFTGVGVDLVLAPSGTYMVDILRDRSAEVMAMSNAIRNVFNALAASLVLPLINTIGVGPTNGLSAATCWIAFLLIWITIRYGTKLRERVDLGYTMKSEP